MGDRWPKKESGRSPEDLAKVDTSIYADREKSLELGFVEAVALLVSQGWSPEYVTEEIPLDVFQQLVLVAYKQKQIELRDFGAMFVSCIGGLFGGKNQRGSPLDYLQDNIANLDEQLRGSSGGPEYDPVLHSSSRSSRRGSAVRHRDLPIEEQQRRTMGMLRKFMPQFNKLAGDHISLDSVIQRSQQFQRQGQQYKEKASDGD